MSPEEEKKLAKQFFSTHLGQAVIQKLNQAKDNEKMIISLSRKNEILKQKLKQHHISIEDNEEEIHEKMKLIDEAVSLLNTSKAPQYLFSIIGRDGVPRGVYTNSIDKILCQTTIEEDYSQLTEEELESLEEE